MAGTHLLANLNGNSASLPHGFAPLGSDVVFTATVANDAEMYISDGVSGAQRLMDMNLAGSSDPQWQTPLGSKLLFTAFTPDLGREMYAIEPGGGGPQLLRDIRTEVTIAGPERLTAIGSHVFFSAIDSDGREPWVTDGTPAGTRTLGNLRAGTDNFGNPAGSAPHGFSRFNGEVVFAATNGTGAAPLGGWGIYATDGTPENTRLLHNLAQVTGSIEDQFVRVVNDRIVYRGRGSGSNAGLWASDGTPQSVTRILDLYPGNTRAEILEMLPVGEDWLAVVSQNDPDDNITDLNGYELWLTDGTSQNTFRVTDPAHTWRSIADITVAGDTLFFRGLAPVGQFVSGDRLYAVDVSAYVPEPGSAGLMLLTGAALLARRWRWTSLDK